MRFIIATGFFYTAIASATKRSWAQSLTCLNLGRILCFTDKARFEELQLAQVPFVNRCELLGNNNKKKQKQK